MKLPTMTFGWFAQWNIALKSLECCTFTIGLCCAVTMAAVITISGTWELCHCMECIFSD